MLKMELKNIIVEVEIYANWCLHNRELISIKDRLKSHQRIDTLSLFHSCDFCFFLPDRLFSNIHDFCSQFIWYTFKRRSRSDRIVQTIELNMMNYYYKYWRTGLWNVCWRASKINHRSKAKWEENEEKQK